MIAPTVHRLEAQALEVVLLEWAAKVPTVAGLSGRAVVVGQTLAVLICSTI
jgi:hypothetical protein